MHKSLPYLTKILLQAFVEGLGVSQEEVMEGPLWREALGRSLGSHDAAELVGGMCHGDGYRQETTRLHAIFCTKTGWSSFTPGSGSIPLREQSTACSRHMSYDPSERELADKKSMLNPLRKDIITTPGAFFDNHPRRKNKALLINIAIVNLAPAQIWRMQHATAVEWKKSSVPTPSFLLLCRHVVRLVQTCTASLRSSHTDW